MRSSPDFLQHRVQGDSNQGSSSSSNKTRSQRPPLRARTTSALATGGTVANVDEASIPPRPPRGPRPPTTTSPIKGNFNAPLRAMSESSTALTSTKDVLTSTPSRVPFNTVNKMTHPPKLVGTTEESQQDEIEIADAYTQYQRYQNHHSQRITITTHIHEPQFRARHTPRQTLRIRWQATRYLHPHQRRAHGA